MMNLSIITATYNVQQTIQTCLDSLHQQTIPLNTSSSMAYPLIQLLKS